MEAQRKGWSAFSSPVFEKAAGGLYAFSWNSRALMHNNAVKKRKKLPLLWKAVHRSRIGLIQESHGNDTAIRQFFAKVDSSHVVHWSSGETADKGGLITTIRKDMLDSDTLLQKDILAQGRIMRSVIRYSCGKSLVIYNVHWYGITSSESSTFLRMLRADISLVKQDPQHHFVVVGGDFNQQRHDAARVAVKGDSFLKSFAQPAPDPNYDGALAQALSGLTEIVQPHPTSYHPGTKSEATIDRWFVGAPAWMLRNMAMRSHVLSRPYDVFSRGISDHSIVHMCLHPVALKPKHMQKNPHWVAKSDVFRGFMRSSSRALQNCGNPQ
eukprot:2083071-Karenia_brevis.AAC.1